MGRIMDKFPFAKFFSPFTVKFKIRNVKVGVFTNALANYYAALAEENNQGLLIRHSHLVIEPVKSLDETDPKDPLNQVCVFQGIERAAPWRKHTLDYVGQGSLSGCSASTQAPGISLRSARLRSTVALVMVSNLHANKRVYDFVSAILLSSTLPRLLVNSCTSYRMPYTVPHLLYSYRLSCALIWSCMLRGNIFDTSLNQAGFTNAFERRRDF